jgi:hypothetical protein
MKKKLLYFAPVKSIDVHGLRIALPRGPTE